MADDAMKGLTAKAALDALKAELEELFEGKSYHGIDGEAELTVFGQLYPIQISNDNGYSPDLARAADLAPSIIVAMTGGDISAPNHQQQVSFQIVACAFDEGTEREGFEDVYAILQEILFHFEEDPYFGSLFEAQYPKTWGIQQEESAPYYYGAISMPVALPVPVVRKSRNKAMEDLL